MSWPLTGKPLAEFNRLLSDWRQYGTFPFIGPDDINRLYDVLVAAGVTGVTLTDLALRPQYWLLILAVQTGGGGGQPSGIDWSPDNTLAESIQIELSGNLTFYSLQTLNSGITISGLGLESVSFPELKNVAGNLAISSSPVLTTVSIPVLETCSVIDTSFNSVLTSFNAPKLISSTLINVIENPLLTEVSIPSYVPPDGSSFLFTGDALSSESVNHILSRCVANAGYVSGTVDLSGGTSAAPSGQGILDAATLTGRGVAVVTN